MRPETARRFSSAEAMETRDPHRRALPRPVCADNDIFMYLISFSTFPQIVLKAISGAIFGVSLCIAIFVDD